MFRKKTSAWVRIHRSREIRLWLATIISGIYVSRQLLNEHPEIKRNLADWYERIANHYRKNPEIKVGPPTNK